MKGCEDQENVTSSCFASSVGILSTRLGGTVDPETARGLIRSRASGVSVAPLDSPTGGYSFDGEREGVVSAGDATQ